MNIYLARHGSTEWNILHLLQGRTDTALDGLGAEMARQSGKKLHESGITFSRVFSSPLRRAHETALLLSGSDNIITDSRLIELGFGEFEGRNVKEMTSDPDCIFRYFKTAPERYDTEIRKINSHKANIGKGAESGAAETLTDLISRVSAFAGEMIEPLIPLSENTQKSRTVATSTQEGETVSGNILICGHGAVNRALLMYFEKRDDLHTFWGSGLQTNCGITKISCTRDASGEVIYDVQDENMIFYDSSLESKCTKLL